MSGKFNWKSASSRKTGPETIVSYDGMNQPVDVSYQLDTSKALGKRWGRDVLEPHPGATPTNKELKQHVLRILAEYARSYRLKTPPRPIQAVPVRLVDQIRGAGGVEEWIEADSFRRNRFWEIVKEQERQPPGPRLSKGPKISVEGSKRRR